METQYKSEHLGLFEQLEFLQAECHFSHTNQVSEREVTKTNNMKTTARIK